MIFNFIHAQFPVFGFFLRKPIDFFHKRERISVFASNNTFSKTSTQLEKNKTQQNKTHGRWRHPFTNILFLKLDKYCPTKRQRRKERVNERKERKRKWVRCFFFWMGSSVGSLEVFRWFTHGLSLSIEAWKETESVSLKPTFQSKHFSFAHLLSLSHTLSVFRCGQMVECRPHFSFHNFTSSHGWSRIAFFLFFSFSYSFLIVSDESEAKKGFRRGIIFYHIFMSFLLMLHLPHIMASSYLLLVFFLFFSWNWMLSSLL